MTWVTFVGAIGGVVVSIVLPPLSVYVRSYFKRLEPSAASAETPRWLIALKPYALLGLFSVITAVMVLAAVGDRVTTWQQALIAGYAWDSTLQKLVRS
jgi:hypothetical protein